MPWNTNLHGIHLNIAAYNGTPLRVVAGPGTGKTYALMRRVARLLEVEHVQPNRILSVTFTRTAANDLFEKLAQLGVPGSDQVAAKTLHSLSFSLLSRTAVFQALNRNARPLMDYERDTLVCDLSRAFGGKREVERFIQAFESYWARMQHHQPGWPHDPQEQAFHHALLAWLRFHRAMLVGEVVPLAYDFITQNPGHPDIPIYEHVLVDEYQDLNRADQALIDAIGSHAAVTVIGDEDQSIYGFRHAHPEGIVEYPQTHAGTHNELLNECRRCPQRVVEVANSLINHNQRLDPKPLNVHPPNGVGQVYIVRHYSVGDEIQTLATYIDWYIQQHPGMPAGEVLVLANRRMIGNGIRNRLNQIAQQNARPWVAQSWEPFRTVLLIMLDSGLRPGEIFRMRWENIHWDKGLIFNPRGKSRKSRRYVPLTERVKAALLMRKEGANEGWVFPSKKAQSGHITDREVSKQWLEAKRLAGIPEAVVLYCARHRFSTDAMEGTGNVMAVMDAMGHQSVNTTRIYNHSNVTLIREAIERRNQQLSETVQ